MIFSYPFNSTHNALEWFFKRPWTRAQGGARSSWPDNDRVQTSTRGDDAEKIYNTVQAIRRIVEAICTARDISILNDYYKYRTAAEVEVAIKYDLTDRGIRYIRDRVITKVNDSFLKNGIVREIQPEAYDPSN